MRLRRDGKPHGSTRSRARLVTSVSWLPSTLFDIDLVKSGSTLQQAVKGRGIYDLVLAAIIWHEMAHIDGQTLGRLIYSIASGQGKARLTSHATPP